MDRAGLLTIGLFTCWLAVTVQAAAITDNRVVTVEVSDGASRAVAISTFGPDLLVDEPTTSLGRGHQLEVLEILSHLNREQGLTAVMSLHDLNLAVQYSDCVVVMQKGQLIAQGEPAQVIIPVSLGWVFNVRAQVIPQDNGKPFCIAQGPLSASELVLSNGKEVM
ncbi:hypothetical protein [Pontibacterium sp.]